MRHTLVVTLGIAAALGSPLAHATSPDLPVVPRIEPGSKMALDGTVAIRLTLEGKADGEYLVTVRRPAAVGGDAKAASRPVVSEVVRADDALVVEDAIAAGRGEVFTVRYEVEVTSADSGYEGVVVASQAFALGDDGTLEAIDFREQMRRHGAELAFDEGQEPAGGASPRPE